MTKFKNHHGYRRTFKADHLSLGLVFPLEAYQSNTPLMHLEQQMQLAQLAEQQGFAALYARDVPLNDPQFGDAGQMYDPWVFLSYVAAKTQHIALGTASAITSFQHPVLLAKSAASVDKISNRRLLLGLATGDRPVEFDVFGVDREKRVALYQQSMATLKKVWAESHPVIADERTQMNGATDVLPKPECGDIPTFVTGFSGQSMEWIAQNSDGWMSYPRQLETQQRLIHDWRQLHQGFKPFMQSLYVDLDADPDAAPRPIHLGFRSGRNYLIAFLEALQDIGVNHVILVFKFLERPVADVIQELGEYVVPHFPAHA